MRLFNDEISYRIKTEFSGPIKRSVNLLRRLSGEELCFPTGLIPLEAGQVREWADGLLRLKRLICGLQARIGMETEPYLALYNLPTAALEYLNRSWARPLSGFFRPDCILTRDGPKVLEFNIDPGSMVFIAGMSPKDFYRKVGSMDADLQKSYGTGLEGSFWAERKFASLLAGMQASGRKIFFWDIAGRGEAQVRERARELDYFRDCGLNIELLEGDEVLRHAAPGNYIFRYFAYTHFLTPHPSLRDSYFRLPADILASSDISAASVLYDSKLNLSMLWDPAVQSRLDPEERALIKRYVPRSYRSGSVPPDVMNSVLRDKGNWIVKSGTGCQGRGTFAGPDLSAEDWRSRVEAAEHDKDHIFQERVTPAALPVELTDGKESFPPGEGHILNFYFVDEEFSGLLFRLTKGGSGTKIGAIDAKAVVAALPLLLPPRNNSAYDGN